MQLPAKLDTEYMPHFNKQRVTSDGEVGEQHLGNKST
jgi:hypothetical protein